MKISEIKQITDGNLTDSELQVAIANKNLQAGIPAILGGDKLSKWLEDNLSEVESIFGCDDQVYIRMKTPDANKKLAEFVTSNNIGDEIQWKKCKEAERWWLHIWWD